MICYKESAICVSFFPRDQDKNVTLSKTFWIEWPFDYRMHDNLKPHKLILFTYNNQIILLIDYIITGLLGPPRPDNRSCPKISIVVLVLKPWKDYAKKFDHFMLRVVWQQLNTITHNWYSYNDIIHSSAPPFCYSPIPIFGCE